MSTLQICLMLLAIVVGLLREITVSYRLILIFFLLIYPMRCLIGLIPNFSRIGKVGKWIVSCISVSFIVSILGLYVLNSKETPDLMLKCDSIALPISWKEGSIRSIEVMGRFASHLGETQRPADKLPGFWPKEGMEHFSEARRYTITNYGNSVVYNISLNFKLYHKESMPMGSGFTSGKVVYEHTSPISIGALNGNGGSFIFYVRNLSGDFIGIESPEFAMIDWKRRVKLKYSGMNYSMLIPHKNVEE